MSTAIHIPFALRLHAFGLVRLHDPNWTGMELYDELKQYMRRKPHALPAGVFYKTLDEGVLWLLGGWFYDELLSTSYILTLGGEYRLWHVALCAEFIGSLEGADRESVSAAEQVATKLEELYAKDEHSYWKAMKRRSRKQERLLDAYERLVHTNETAISKARREYAANYADRVFHDRQLCEFISNLVFEIGIDGGLDEGEEPFQWVDRARWPSWVRRALIARERGRCALCGSALTLELEEEAHIDHIVPLAHGGTNDLVNLQLLCAPCNLKKRANLVSVTSSVPEYLSRRLRAGESQ